MADDKRAHKPRSFRASLGIAIAMAVAMAVFAIVACGFADRLIQDGGIFAASVERAYAAPAGESGTAKDDDADSSEADTPSEENEETGATIVREIDLGDDNKINTRQLPDSSFIYDTSLEDLATADSYYDGMMVQVTGEVVGDIVKGDLGSGMVWVSLAAIDGSNVPALAVCVSESDAAKIDALGRYGTTGTIVQVRGVFHLACIEHEGISDLHSVAFTVNAEGKDASERFDWRSFVPGIAFLLVAGVLYLLYRHLRERGR